ncbi:MAG TPA: hypothetical protein VFI25_13635 [Planctomycetota bacterium]|nr:hypothetical protein [Planctomycetota bacterium]
MGGSAVFALALGGISILVRGEGMEPTGVRLGIPFVPGEAKGFAGGRVRDRVGRAVPSSSRVSEKWPDGSPRWIDAEIEASPGVYRFDAGEPPPDSSTFRIREGEAGIDVAGDRWGVSLPRSGEALAILSDERCGRVRILWPGAGHGPVRRRLLLEAGGSFLADARVEEEREDGFAVEIRLRIHRTPSLCELEICFANGSGELGDPEDQELAIVWEGGADRSIASIGRGEEVAFAPEAHPFSIRAEEDGSTRVEPGSSGRVEPRGLLAFERGGGRLLLGVRRFRESGPVALEVEEPGTARLCLAPEDPLTPGSATALRGALRFAPEGMAAGKAYRSLTRPTRALLDRERYEASGELEHAGRARNPREVEAERSVHSAALALLRDREVGGRNFGDFRISPRSWGNLEYDTAYGLVLAFVRSGEEAFLEGAEEALFHARTVDRARLPFDPAWAGFPHRHGPDHRGRPDVGHAWVEGAVELSRFTGDPAPRAYALAVGETLSRLVREPRHRDTERNAGWPLVALSCLADAFPGRGFETGMEDLASQLLERYRRPGYFRFETRVERGTGNMRVSTWLQGGLLLEALEKYRLAGGKRPVEEEAAGLARLLAREALDGRRGRLHGFLRIEEEKGRIVGKGGSVPPPYSLYPAAGLIRAGRMAGDPLLPRVAGAWIASLRPSLPGFRARFPANGISIALRSFPFALDGR